MCAFATNTFYSVKILPEKMKYLNLTTFVQFDSINLFCSFLNGQLDLDWL